MLTSAADHKRPATPEKQIVNTDLANSLLHGPTEAKTRKRPTQSIPTNRERYEQDIAGKKLPWPPIKPVVPLVNTVSMRQESRSFTAPLPPKPQFADNRMVENRLHNAFKQEHIALSSTVDTFVPHKAIEILGLGDSFTKLPESCPAMDEEHQRPEAVKQVLQRSVQETRASALSETSRYDDETGEESELDNDTLLKPITYSPHSRQGIWLKASHVQQLSGSPARALRADLAQSAPEGDKLGPKSCPRGVNSCESAREDFLLPPTTASSWPSQYAASSQNSNHGQPSASLPIQPGLVAHASAPPRIHQVDDEGIARLAADILRLDQTVHHHLELGFHSVSRQLSERHEKTIEMIVRRFDELEKRLEQGLGDTRYNVHKVVEDVGSVRKDVARLEQIGDESRKLLVRIAKTPDSISKPLGQENKPIEGAASHTNIRMQTIPPTPGRKSGRSRANSHADTYSALRSVLGKSADKMGSNRGQSGGLKPPLLMNAVATNPAPHQHYPPSTQEHKVNRQMMDQGSSAANFDHTGVPIPHMYPTNLAYPMQVFPNAGWYHEAYGRANSQLQ